MRGVSVLIMYLLGLGAIISFGIAGLVSRAVCIEFSSSKIVGR
jgi:hypothetical protein